MSANLCRHFVPTRENDPSLHGKGNSPRRTLSFNLYIASYLYIHKSLIQLKLGWPVREINPSLYLHNLNKKIIQIKYVMKYFN